MKYLYFFFGLIKVLGKFFLLGESGKNCVSKHMPWYGNNFFLYFNFWAVYSCTPGRFEKIFNFILELFDFKEPT